MAIPIAVDDRHFVIMATTLWSSSGHHTHRQIGHRAGIYGRDLHGIADLLVL